MARGERVHPDARELEVVAGSEGREGNGVLELLQPRTRRAHLLACEKLGGAAELGELSRGDPKPFHVVGVLVRNEYGEESCVMCTWMELIRDLDRYPKLDNDILNKILYY